LLFFGETEPMTQEILGVFGCLRFAEIDFLGTDEMIGKLFML
jgi:hypothetical protein